MGKVMDRRHQMKRRSRVILGLGLVCTVVAMGCSSKGSGTTGTGENGDSEQYVAEGSKSESSGTNQLDVAPDLPDEPDPVGEEDGSKPVADAQLEERLGRAGFTQLRSVFGVPVAATSTVSVGTVDHVAAVLTGYLDNDGDGSPDNPQIVSALKQESGVAAVFDTFRSMDQFFDSDRGEDLDGIELIGMTEEEINQPDEFDASLEEVLHLVTQFGFAVAYPDELGEDPNSTLGIALKEATQAGYFAYDDPTCDEPCMITEFFYWAITSNMGLQADRCEDIAHEWRLCTPESLTEANLAVTDLINDNVFKIPTAPPLTAAR